jgi:hypothetical protein
MKFKIEDTPKNVAIVLSILNLFIQGPQATMQHMTQNLLVPLK